MTIQFDEIGQTIAIGALFSISICLLLRHFTDMQEIFKQLNSIKLPPLFVTAVLLAFLYSIGILAQSISKNTVANRRPNLDWLMPNYFLPYDSQMRGTSLDTFLQRCSPLERQTMESLYTKLLTRSPQNDDEKNNIFFFCKNKVYSDTRYYSELKGIENKLFFTTSLSFISWVSIMFYLYFIAYYWVRRKINKDIAKVQIREKYKHEFYFIAILGILLIAGCISYRSLQDSFNLRIFGYYTANAMG